MILVRTLLFVQISYIGGRAIVAAVVDASAGVPAVPLGKRINTAVIITGYSGDPSVSDTDIQDRQTRQTNDIVLVLV